MENALKYKISKKHTKPRVVQTNRTELESEVYPFKVQDIKKIANYFLENEMWLYYMLFVLSCNMARRVGDMLSLRWDHIFNPATGEFRERTPKVKEQKTDKFACPKINTACQDAIRLYIEKTGCDVSENDYQTPVFTNLTGTRTGAYKGNVISSRAYLSALKKAGESVGIEYNIGTHSARKTFGTLSRLLHPTDINSMVLLQKIFNHSSVDITSDYIGLTREHADAYYDDMGAFYDDYIIGDKEFSGFSCVPIVSFDINDIRDLVLSAYEMGMKRSGDVDENLRIHDIGDIMKRLDEIKK